MKKNKHVFAIDLGNKSAKLKSDGSIPLSIPSRYIPESAVNGSNRFETVSNSMFKEFVDVKKYQLVNNSKSYYFGTGINELGKDSKIRESLGVGKHRYDSQKFKDMLSFTIAELALPLVEGDDILKAELVLGLPSEDYTKSNIEAVAKYAKSQHSVLIDDNPVNVKITKVSILPQPIGTFYNVLFDNDGTMVRPELVNQKVGIVDIGGLTKLFDSLLNFKMDTEEREQKDTGIWALYNTIIEMLDLDSSIKPNKYQLEKAIREGILNNNNFILKPKKTASDENIIDITDVVQEAIDLYTEETIDETMNVFTHFSSIDLLIFTGGGSAIINKKLIKEAFTNTNVMFAEDGEFTNVLGFYKYGIME